MKTTSKKANRSGTTRTSRSTSPIKGADVVVLALEREGVDTIFAYPGGASMEMHQSLTRSQQIRTILPRHEQGGVFAAEGYARACGRTGVVMATSGPGATNLVTGIADAYLDSVPLVAITGQVPSFMIGRGAFQETDVYGVTLPIVKHSYLVTDVQDLPRIIKEAFYIAGSGRPGPVVIDIPKNIQQTFVQPTFPDGVNLRGYSLPPAPEPSTIAEILALLNKAERPVLYVGGGIISSGAHLELLRFAEKTGIPVATTLMGIGGFPESHPLSLKWLGMHGTVAANNAVNEADLLLALGVRFDDRVTGRVEDFAKHGTIVHVDIDNSEINKNKPVQMPIQCDVREALRLLNRMMTKQPVDSARFKAWREKVLAWHKAHPYKFVDTEDAIQPQYAVRRLDEVTRGEAIITTGVGQHQMWAAQFYDYDQPRSFLTSAGLGSMGFGYPAALGAKVACPEKEVVDVDGDGSFMMNIQELATAAIERIPAKAMILNNQYLGMVVQWEDRFYKSNRGHTFLGDPRDARRIYPDFPKICEGFGVACEQVKHKKDLDKALARMIESRDPYVVEVMVPYTEHVLPMIPSGKTYRDIITEPDGSGPHQAKQMLVPGSGL
jgi:acetolactate synthase-1/2/3 large subunit